MPRPKKIKSRVPEQVMRPEPSPRPQPARTPLELLDSLLADAPPSLEDRLAQMIRDASQSTKYSMFRTARGLLFLEELTDSEARHFAERGKLSPEEIREWFAWRHRRLSYPQAARYELFNLKCRRLGIKSFCVYDDGRVIFS